MKKGSLPIGWIRWRRRRYQALAAVGLSSHLAWEVAAAEANGRHRISGIVGKRAARNAELQCTITDGKLRFFLVGDTDNASGHQRAATEELKCRAKTAA